MTLADVVFEEIRSRTHPNNHAYLSAEMLPDMHAPRIYEATKKISVSDSIFEDLIRTTHVYNPYNSPLLYRSREEPMGMVQDQQVLRRNVSRPPCVPTRRLNIFNAYPLIRRTMQEKTQRLYLSAFESFRKIARWPPSSPGDIDETIAGYICDMYEENDSAGHRQEMEYLISYICLAYPEHKSSLGLSRRVISGWKKHRPAMSAIPITKSVLLAFIQRLMEKNEKTAAVAMGVQWAAYLRGSEVLKLTRRHLALPGDFRLQKHGVTCAGINVENAKTGPLQFTALRDCDILILLKAHMLANNTSTFLFDIPYSRYNQLWKDTAAFFELRGKFTTHSARIGGALHDYSAGMSAETIAVHGRWKSFKSLETYLTNGRAWLMNMPSGPRSQILIDEYSYRCRRLIMKCQDFIKISP